MLWFRVCQTKTDPGRLGDKIAANILAQTAKARPILGSLLIWAGVGGGGGGGVGFRV